MQVFQANPLSRKGCLLYQLDRVVVLSATHRKLQVVLSAHLSLAKFLQLLRRVVSWGHNEQRRSVFVNLLWNNVGKCLRCPSNTWNGQFLRYEGIQSILKSFWLKNHENQDPLEASQFVASFREVLLRLLAFVPLFKIFVVEVDLLSQFGEVKAKTVETLLSIECWPRGKDDLIFQGRRNESCKEVPLLGCDLLRKNSLSEVQSKGQAVFLEESTRNVAKDDFIDFSEGELDSCVDRIFFDWELSVCVQTAEEKFCEIFQGESVHVIDFPKLGQDKIKGGSLLCQRSVSVSLGIQLYVKLFGLGEALLNAGWLDLDFGQVIQKDFVLQNVSWWVTKLLEQLFFQLNQTHLEFFFFVKQFGFPGLKLGCFLVDDQWKQFAFEARLGHGVVYQRHKCPGIRG